jgi:predicted dithiol-disulfide oxidoreductase (DUF899 family)
MDFLELTHLATRPKRTPRRSPPRTDDAADLQADLQANQTILRRLSATRNRDDPPRRPPRPAIRDISPQTRSTLMEATMTVETNNDAAPARPAVVDRAEWQAEIDKLRVREKAHTREGDAIAAARRRLPMVEMDPEITLAGPDGPVTLLEVFEGRRQLIAYFHMWRDGQPADEQCEGCTFFSSQVRELSYLHSRDITYATFCQGSFDESVRYRDFMGWDVPWYSVRDCAEKLLAGRPFFLMACYLRDGDRVFETYATTTRGFEVMTPTHGLMDMTVYGRQETWEDSPAGWPQRWVARTPSVWRTDGRPTAQWSRLAAGRSDDLRPAGR